VSKAQAVAVILLIALGAGNLCAEYSEYDMDGKIVEWAPGRWRDIEIEVPLGVIHCRPIEAWVRDDATLNRGLRPIEPPDELCVFGYGGPSPFSTGIPLYVECRSDILYVIQCSSEACSDSLSVQNLEPGWYWIIPRVYVPPGSTTVSVWSSGILLDEETWTRGE